MLDALLHGIPVEKPPRRVRTSRKSELARRAPPTLPRGIDPPVVGKLDPDAVPILFVAIQSSRPLRETTEIADKRVRRQIESIPGVEQVNLLGGRKWQINVWLDPVKLRAAGLTPQDVQRALRHRT